MIVPLEEKYIKELADLHLRVLGHTVNSRIGRWFLVKLYSQLLAGKNGNCFVYLNNNQVRGFISFCIDHAELARVTAGSLSIKEKVRIISFLVVHPGLFMFFVKQQLFFHYMSKLPQPQAAILTLGVDPESSGKGVGQALVDTAKQIVRRRGSNVLYVDTEVNNIRAISLYNRCGFAKISGKYGNILLKISL